MEAVFNHIMENIYFYMLITFIIILIIVLIVTKPKKVEPIEITIDDVKDEKTDIERVIESLEENKNARPMTTFEEEQEANAIISYQELVDAVKHKKELMGIKEEIVTKEAVANNISKEMPIVEAIEQVEVKEEPKKFKSSEFISPIFGKDSNRTNDDFLRELKNFRNNL